MKFNQYYTKTSFQKTDAFENFRHTNKILSTKLGKDFELSTNVFDETVNFIFF